VHLVFVDGTEALLPTGSPLANAIGQVAALLAGDPRR
jgi:hypothetical protein